MLQPHSKRRRPPPCPAAPWRAHLGSLVVRKGTSPRSPGRWRTAERTRGVSCGRWGVAGGSGRLGLLPAEPFSCTRCQTRVGGRAGHWEAGPQGRARSGVSVAARPRPHAPIPLPTPLPASLLPLPKLQAGAGPLTFRQSWGCLSTSGYCTCGGLGSGPGRPCPPPPRPVATHPAPCRPAGVLQLVAEGPWLRAPAQAHVAAHGTGGLPAQCLASGVVADGVPQCLCVCRDPPQGLQSAEPSTCFRDCWATARLRCSFPAGLWALAKCVCVCVRVPVRCQGAEPSAG